MKILHTADWHVGRTIRGRSRAEEHREVLAEIVDVAADRQVDLVVVAGDLFDSAAPSAESERLVYRALLDLAEVAPVVAVAGNHDHPGRLRAVTPLLDLGRVTMAATPARPDEGGRVTVTTDTGEVARLALLPFVSRRAIVRAQHLMEGEAAEHEGTYAARLQSVIAHLVGDLDLDVVNLVVAHVMVHGATLGGGERSAHTIFDYSIPASSFPGGLGYVALGHLHRPQRIPAPAPVWYSGSPLQLDFGEVADTKAVLVVEAEPGVPARVEEVPLRGGRRLVHLAGTFEEVIEAGRRMDGVYLRVELDEPARAGLADDVRAELPDAVDVVLAPSRREARSRDRAPRRGRSPIELFAEYLEERGARDERVEGLFVELLDEVHAAPPP